MAANPSTPCHHQYQYQFKHIHSLPDVTLTKVLLYLTLEDLGCLQISYSNFHQSILQCTRSMDEDTWLPTLRAYSISANNDASTYKTYPIVRYVKLEGIPFDDCLFFNALSGCGKKLESMCLRYPVGGSVVNDEVRRIIPPRFDLPLLEKLHFDTLEHSRGFYPRSSCPSLNSLILRDCHH